MPVTTFTAPSTNLRPRLLLNCGLAVVLALVLGYVLLRPHGPGGSAGAAVPQSTQLESRTGVRFSRVAVVGDGGLVTLSYVVLDAEKASAFQADREHPPRLASEARHGGTQRASIMRAGHQMRAGQTYYFVYENTGGAIESGEQVTISYDGLSLEHVPVL
ncbi:hypothetical protein [Nocardioides sp. CER19]|uniref:hypothetical protein n=1 Tax=Nocardioides sp. CER19 TaxID=3038538 RepID=UPI00244967A8|nr:hypothetical protein [Nocardioides sp. CER19]MDH2413970.1 hypothetical protein [Nocardioides sp. CER19]